MSNRMPGHELVAEGAPHDPKGRRVSTIYGGVSGAGCAKCSCGELSPGLDSANKRKLWHRAHKEELRKESTR
jgi:hypothetical protein